MTGHSPQILAFNWLFLKTPPVHLYLVAGSSHSLYEAPQKGSIWIPSHHNMQTTFLFLGPLFTLRWRGALVGQEF